MKKFLKWTALGSTAMIAALLSPLAYVETACRPSVVADNYEPRLAPEKHRDEGRTLMTYPEWAIVHAYDEYAEVVRTDDPHDFGYLSAISGFWGSLCGLSQASGPHGGFSGDIKTTVYTIGVSFTLEMLAKASYEETLGRLATMVRGNERAYLDDLSADQARAYSKFLQQTPWYKWDFDQSRDELQIGPASFRDTERRFALGIEYGVKAAYARAIESAVSQMEPDALRLNMIVTNINRKALGALPDTKIMAILDEGVEIETPRYRKLTHLLERMAGQGADFIEIAGNDDILLTVTSYQDQLDGSLYSVQRQGYDDYRHLVLLKVTDLASFLRSLPADGFPNEWDQRVVLEHIHDY